MKQIVFLHGALGSKKHFEKITKELTGYFEVFSFDFIGHGENNLHSEGLSIELFTEDLRNFISSNNLNKPSIFGYSMGGYVALNLALNETEMIDKIFTFATKFDWNEESANRESKMLNPEKIKEKVPKYAADLYELHGDKWEKLMSQTADFMVELGANPLFTSETMKSINNQVLISVGDKDSMVSIEESLIAYRSLQNSSFAVFPDTIHPISKINIKRLKDEMIRFFD